MTELTELEAALRMHEVQFARANRLDQMLANAYQLLRETADGLDILTDTFGIDPLVKTETSILAARIRRALS